MSLSSQPASTNILSQVLDGYLDNISNTRGLPLETHVGLIVQQYKTRLREKDESLSALNEGIVTTYIRSEIQRALQ